MQYDRTTALLGSTTSIASKRPDSKLRPIPDRGSPRRLTTITLPEVSATRIDFTPELSNDFCSIGPSTNESIPTIPSPHLPQNSLMPPTLLLLIVSHRLPSTSTTFLSGGRPLLDPSLCPFRIFSKELTPVILHPFRVNSLLFRRHLRCRVSSLSLFRSRRQLLTNLCCFLDSVLLLEGRHQKIRTSFGEGTRISSNPETNSYRLVPARPPPPRNRSAP